MTTCLLMIMEDYGSCHMPSFYAIAFSGKNQHDLEGQVMELIEGLKANEHIIDVQWGSTILWSGVPYLG